MFFSDRRLKQGRFEHLHLIPEQIESNQPYPPQENCSLFTSLLCLVLVLVLVKRSKIIAKYDAVQKQTKVYSPKICLKKRAVFWLKIMTKVFFAGLL